MADDNLWQALNPRLSTARDPVYAKLDKTGQLDAGALKAIDKFVAGQGIEISVIRAEIQRRGWPKSGLNSFLRG